MDSTLTVGGALFDRSCPSCSPSFASFLSSAQPCAECRRRDPAALAVVVVATNSRGLSRRAEFAIDEASGVLTRRDDRGRVEATAAATGAASISEPIEAARACGAVSGRDLDADSLTDGAATAATPDAAALPPLVPGRTGAPEGWRERAEEETAAEAAAAGAATEEEEAAVPAELRGAGDAARAFDDDTAETEEDDACKSSSCSTSTNSSPSSS